MTSKCSCATFQTKTGKCWKEASCVPVGFATDKQFTVFVNEAKQPRCVGCPDPTPVPEGAKAVSFDIEVDGFGCVLTTSGAPSAAVQTFLTSMKTMSEKPLYVDSRVASM